MFFRYLDDDHPANRGKDTTEHKDALYQMYRDMDELVGQTMEYVDKDTAFFVISDHGFKAFKRGVNLNTWFREQGLLATKEGAGEGEYLSSVDWAKTKAYSVGLGGIFINKKGRERKGIVDEKEFVSLKVKIAEGLCNLKDNGTLPVNRLIDVQEEFSGPYRDDGPDLIPAFKEGYRVSWDCAKGTITDEVIKDNTRSWSGDHCMDPSIVPGILFSNMKVSETNPRLMDIGPTVLELFGVDVPAHMTGKSIL
jgi:predicted AlkP superfamily phosphohydrolase/phosphomutase